MLVLNEENNSYKSFEPKLKTVASQSQSQFSSWQLF